MFRRTGRADDQIHFGRMHIGHFQGLARRLGSQRCGGLLGHGYDPPLLDAGARADPLVLGIDDLLQIMICDDPFGNMIAPADDLRIAGRLHPVQSRRLRGRFRMISVHI